MSNAEQIFENPESGKEVIVSHDDNKADTIIATIQANDQQVITEQELARVVGCDRTSLRDIRQQHIDRFTVIDGETKGGGNCPPLHGRLIYKIKMPTAGGDQLQNCYSAKAALEVCRHLRKPVADEVMDKLYELAEQKPLAAPQKTPHELVLESMQYLISEVEKERTLRLAAETKIAADADKVDFAEQILESRHGIAIGSFAKILHDNGMNVGRTRLFAMLRADKYLMDDNELYQKWKERGFFEVVEGYFEKPCGDRVPYTKTLITPRGQKYLLQQYFPGTSVSILKKKGSELK